MNEYPITLTLRAGNDILVIGAIFDSAIYNLYNPLIIFK